MIACGSLTTDVSRNDRKAAYTSGAQSIWGRAWSPNPGQSIESVEYSCAIRSCKGRISWRVEIELRAGRRRIVRPLPPSVELRRIAFPPQLQSTARVSIAQLVPRVARNARQFVAPVASNVIARQH